MRSVFAFGLSLILAGAAPATGATAGSGAPAPAEAARAEAPLTSKERLDKLFSELKRERNEQAAARIAQNIWTQWFNSGSASVDLMMQWSNDALKKRKFDVALDFLDQVTLLQPDFAEGWNRRATVHFMMREYAKSMADIEKTLQLEPRHFGALSGMAQIMKATGRKQLALEAWQRVLAIYPMMRSAQTELSTLSEDLAGEGI